MADQIEEWFTGGAIDGFTVYVEQPAQFRRFVEEVVPILQQKGICRSDYEATTLRGHLGLAIPENRHTVTR